MRSLLSLLLAITLLWSSAVPAWAEGITQGQIDESTQLWEASAHALNNVNCSSCHQASPPDQPSASKVF
ncbi:MAG: hypothetical protein AAGD25_35005, partial [Cyanobacteria bacterium P01_F01_bin.150]